MSPRARLMVAAVGLAFAAAACGPTIAPLGARWPEMANWRDASACSGPERVRGGVTCFTLETLGPSRARTLVVALDPATDLAVLSAAAPQARVVRPSAPEASADAIGFAIDTLEARAQASRVVVLAPAATLAALRPSVADRTVATDDPAHDPAEALRR